MIENTIICGECSKVLNEQFPENCIDCVICSPPYSKIRDYNGFEFDCDKIVKSLYRVMKPGGVVVWVCGDQAVNCSETGESFRQALNFLDNKFLIHDTIIYQKNTSSFPARRTGNRYTQIFEYMFVMSKDVKPKTANLICDKPNKWAGWVNWGKKTHRNKEGELVETKDIKPVPEFSVRNNLWEYDVSPEELLAMQDEEEQTEIKRTNIWKYTVGKGYAHTDKLAYDHPATFPEKLVEDHIKSWSNEGDLVLDPMCGSGTTLKMAKLLKRNYIGIDCSSSYCELSQRRVDLVK